MIPGQAQQTIAVPVEVSRFRVEEDSLRVDVTLEDMDFTFLTRTVKGKHEVWLQVVGGPQSIQLDAAVIGSLLVRGWQMQWGTEPVKVDGSWGGRNYPAFRLPASSCETILDIVLGWAAIAKVTW